MESSDDEGNARLHGGNSAESRVCVGSSRGSESGSERSGPSSPAGSVNSENSAPRSPAGSVNSEHSDEVHISEPEVSDHESDNEQMEVSDAEVSDRESNENMSEKESDHEDDERDRPNMDDTNEVNIDSDDEDTQTKSESRTRGDKGGDSQSEEEEDVNKADDYMSDGESKASDKEITPRSRRKSVSNAADSDVEEAEEMSTKAASDDESAKAVSDDEDEKKSTKADSDDDGDKSTKSDSDEEQSRAKTGLESDNDERVSAKAASESDNDDERTSAKAASESDDDDERTSAKAASESDDDERTSAKAASESDDDERTSAKAAADDDERMSTKAGSDSDDEERGSAKASSDVEDASERVSAKAASDDDERASEKAASDNEEDERTSKKADSDSDDERTSVKAGSDSDNDDERKSEKASSDRASAKAISDDEDEKKSTKADSDDENKSAKDGTDDEAEAKGDKDDSDEDAIKPTKSQKKNKKQRFNDVIADIFGDSDDDEEFTGFTQADVDAARLRKEKFLREHKIKLVESGEESSDDDDEGAEEAEQPESEAEQQDIESEAEQETVEVVEEVKSFAKKNTSQQVVSDDDSDEGVNKASDGSFLSDFDLMMAKKKEESSRRRKRHNVDIINDSDDLIAEIISQMRLAADDDRELNKHKKTATKKLKILPLVMSQLKKQDLKMAFLDQGVLNVIADWLAPLPDRSLPHLQIREGMIKMLNEFPIIDHSLLKSSGVGRVLMYLYKHPKETKENKEKASRLITEWARPIFNVTTDYHSLTKEEREQRDFHHIPKKRKLRDESTDDAEGTERKDIDKALSQSDRKLRPGDKGWVARARVPLPSNRDYVVRPKWNVEMEFGKGVSKKPLNRFEKHLRTMQDKKKSSKGQRAVTISIEGRKMAI